MTLPNLHLLESKLVQPLEPGLACHASSLLDWGGGRLCMSFFAGSKEGADDVKIYLAHYRAGSWSPAEVLADGFNEPHWNPVLQHLGGGHALLYYKLGKTIKNWRSFLRRTEDFGQSWSPPRLLDAEDPVDRGPARTKLLTAQSGRWLAAASCEDGAWRCFVDISDDTGAHWRRSQEIGIGAWRQAYARAERYREIAVSEQSYHGRGVIQPTLWESEAGHIHMLMRSTEGALYRSDSSDNGEQWSPAARTDFPNNNSGIDVVRHAGGLFLAANPVGENWGPRTPLNLFFSSDNGHRWNTVFTAAQAEGEYAYPALIAGAGSELFLSFTENRCGIRFNRLAWY